MGGGGGVRGAIGINLDLKRRLFIKGKVSAVNREESGNID